MIYIYLLLLRIVAYLEGEQKIISFIIVAILMIFSILKRTKRGTITKISQLNFNVIVLIVFVVIHGLIFGEVLVRDVAVLFTYWLWFIFTLNYFKDKSLNQILTFILITFFIFNISNYISFKLIDPDQKYGVNTIMSYLGVFGYRIYFPLSSGANIFAFQLALNTLLALYFIKNKIKKKFSILIFCFYIYMMVLADSRLVLLFTFFFAFLYWVSLKTIISFIKNYWLFISFIFIGLLFVFYKTDIFQGLKRPGEIKGHVLSRIDIWEYAFGVIFDDYKLILGHGLNGFENNINPDVQKMFKNESLQTAHNFLIQNIIDFGFLGIIFILYWIFKLIKIVQSIKVEIITLLLVMFLIMGTTESIPTFYSFDSNMFFIVLLSTIIILNERKIIRHS